MPRIAVNFCCGDDLFGSKWLIWCCRWNGRSGQNWRGAITQVKTVLGRRSRDLTERVFLEGMGMLWISLKSGI